VQKTDKASTRNGQPNNNGSTTNTSGPNSKKSKPKQNMLLDKRD
jgi:hypothetical protein